MDTASARSLRVSMAGLGDPNQNRSNSPQGCPFLKNSLPCLETGPGWGKAPQIHGLAASQGKIPNKVMHQGTRLHQEPAPSAPGAFSCSQDSQLSWDFNRSGMRWEVLVNQDHGQIPLCPKAALQESRNGETLGSARLKHPTADALPAFLCFLGYPTGADDISMFCRPASPSRSATRPWMGQWAPGTTRNSWRRPACTQKGMEGIPWRPTASCPATGTAPTPLPGNPTSNPRRGASGGNGTRSSWLWECGGHWEGLDCRERAASSQGCSKGRLLPSEDPWNSCR